MMKQTLKRGFTLIELLVVIAIIGILASVVLASLNSARDKGADAAIKSNLNNIRAQAEIVYDDAGGDYAAVCANSNVSQAITAAGATCYDDADEWGAEAVLSDSTYYCVNSTGAASTTGATSGLADGATACDGS